LLRYFFGSGKVLRRIENEASRYFEYNNLTASANTIFNNVQKSGFSRIPSLSNDSCLELTDLIEKNGVYTYLGESSDNFNSPLFNGKVPDYKIYDATHVLDDNLKQELVPPDILQAAENYTKMRMKISWINIYKTFARDPKSLPRGGKYVSFDWHFDNSGFTKTLKIMYLLSTVTSIEDGAFQIKSSGRRYKTFLAGLGNSRLHLADYFDRSSTILFTGSRSNGAIFDVSCAHRGGSTFTSDRSVVVIELVPCEVRHG